MKLKKSYKFALKSAFYIALFCFIITLFFIYIFYNKIDLYEALSVSILVFIFSFFLVQYRVERFIYKRVKKIYEEVSLLDVKELRKSSVTSDIESLSKEVKKFAENKRLEIEMLKIREEYRREFLGDVSHELKTPLFTVQGYLLTLLEGAIKDKTIRDKYLSRANKSVDRLISVVKDLDMISGLESGNLNLHIETFNIIAIIQNVFDLLEFESKKRNILLAFDKKYDVPILVKGDAKRIEQVLINLVENSIKYGRQKGETAVSITNYSSKKFLIKIVDDGEGIQQHHLPRLFDRFYRVDQSRSREQGGSGLGLSIVKHIIEAHNEHVFVESNYGKGSTFSFTLKKVK